MFHLVLQLKFCNLDSVRSECSLLWLVLPMCFFKLGIETVAVTQVGGRESAALGFDISFKSKTSRHCWIGIDFAF